MTLHIMDTGSRACSVGLGDRAGSVCYSNEADVPITGIGYGLAQRICAESTD